MNNDPATDTGARDELLASLTDHFIRRHRAGERPAVDDYAARHPDLAEQIREFLGAALAIEQAGTAASDPGASFEAVGTTIGRYKLLERIGEGGFGIVYMAEQKNPVRGKVALKVIKPGFDMR
jgi:hypothetical protein